MKFIDDLPPKADKRGALLKRERTVQALRGNPGRWAEVSRSTSWSGPNSLRKRWAGLYPDVEIEVRRDSATGEYVGYARAVMS